MKTLLYGPREEVLFDEQLEYREANVKTYRELIEVGSLFGTDFTALKEFLGIACIASVLRAHGHPVDILIAGNEKLSDDQVVDAIVESSPDVLGVSLLYDLQLLNALNIARKVKERLPETRVVFGGAYASVDAEELIGRFEYIDYVVRSEGELSIIALYEALASGNGFDQVSGLTYRRNGRHFANPVQLAANLDDLPTPARDVLRAMKGTGTPIASAYVYSSRGCKGKCVFCTAPRLSHESPVKWRHRSPAKVIDEIEELVGAFGVRNFYFTDDNFYGYGSDNRHRLNELAQEIRKRNLQIHFHAECRVDSLDEDLVVNLKSAGLHQLLLGIESGSNKTLLRWGKHQSVADNERAIALARKHEFELIPSMILLDWESTLDEVQETVDFIARNKLCEITYPLSLVNKLHILVGTAAATRYRKTHDVAPLPEIIDEQSLRQWIIVHTFQNVGIEDLYVAAFWRHLSLEVNRWYLISQDILPRLLSSLRRHRPMLQVTIRTISQLRKWRARLGFNLQRLMDMLLEELQRHRREVNEVFDLSDQVRSWVRSWESEIFPTTLEHALHDCRGVLLDHEAKYHHTNVQ